MIMYFRTILTIQPESLLQEGLKQADILLLSYTRFTEGFSLLHINKKVFQGPSDEILLTRKDFCRETK